MKGKKFAGIVAVLALIVAALLWIGPKNEEPQKTKVTKPILLPPWKITWEKAAGYRGRTNARQNPIEIRARVEKKDDKELVISYAGFKPQGGVKKGWKKVLEGKISAEKKPEADIYSGQWEDPTGKGDIALKFLSPSSAEFSMWDGKAKPGPPPITGVLQLAD